LTRITNADQVLLLLRSHLQRMDRSQHKGAARPERNAAKSTPLERVQATVNAEDLSEEEVERALISGIFTEEFGSAVASDPKFQLMTDDVLSVLRQDATGRLLLNRAVAQLVGDR
jgi:hypothetical protein